MQKKIIQLNRMSFKAEPHAFKIKFFGHTVMEEGYLKENEFLFGSIQNLSSDNVDLQIINKEFTFLATLQKELKGVLFNRLIKQPTQVGAPNLYFEGLKLTLLDDKYNNINQMDIVKIKVSSESPSESESVKKKVVDPNQFSNSEINR